MPRRDKEPAFEDYGFRPFKPPVMTPTRRIDIDRAAALHTEANRSDPFAFRRVVMHMKRGLELPSDVAKDATRLITARREAKGADCL